MGWEWINTSSKKFRLGDDPVSGEKIHMFNYRKDDPITSSGQPKDCYRNSETGSFRWQSGDLFSSFDVCVKYKNETSGPVKIKEVGIKACSNNSNGNSYYSWSSGSYNITDGCNGYGGFYYAKVRVFDDISSWPAHNDMTNLYRNVTPVQESKGSSVPVDNSPYNMVSRGSTSISATFDFSSAVMTTYSFQDPVIVQPGQIAFVHFGMEKFVNWTDFTNKKYSELTQYQCMTSSYQFSLTPSEMEIVIEPADDPAIWQFQSDGQWHLVEYLYKHDGTNWVNMYGK